MKTAMRISLLFGLLIGLSACADTAPHHRQIFVELPPSGVLIPDDNGDPLPSIAEGGGYILLVDGDEDREVPVGGDTELRVLLFDTTGAPVEGQRISFTVNEDAIGDARLSARNAVTDSQGAAEVDLRAGEDVAEYTISAQGPGPQPVQFYIRVVNLPTGTIDIEFEEDGLVDIGAVEVFLIPDVEWCDDPYYLAPPPNPIETHYVEWHTDGLVLGPIIAGSRFSLVARGRLAESGVLAAGGCVSDVRVRADEQINVNMLLRTLPLNPAGTYEVVNHFDFTGALPGTLGDVIRGLVDFFGTQNHTRNIAGLLIDLVEAGVRRILGEIGAAIISLIGDWVEGPLNDIINDWIDDDAPDWVQDFFTIGSDLVSIVAYMEVISEMRFTKPRRDGEFNGSQNWVGLAVYWRLGCGPNDPDDCGRYAFTMDDLIADGDGIQLVFGQFDGRIHSYDQGVIYAHTLDLQYGRFIMFILNNLILPVVADGATNLRDALLNLTNCAGFALSITGRDGEIDFGVARVTDDQIAGICEDIIGGVGSVASSILGGLRIDTRLTLDGTLRFVEENDDLLPDQIVEGVWRGIIRTNQDEGPPFEGDFAGSRMSEDREE